MGDEPLAIRQEVERTRSRMGDTVAALAYRTDVRSRTHDAISHLKDTAGMSVIASRRQLGERGTVMAAAAAAVVILTAGVTVVLTRRSLAERRGDRLVRPARRLPPSLARLAIPAAQHVDSAVAGAGEALQSTRQRALRRMSDEIARSLAEEQQRRNPFWRRAARDAVSAAATTAATLAVRRVVGGAERGGR